MSPAPADAKIEEVLASIRPLVLPLSRRAGDPVEDLARRAVEGLHGLLRAVLPNASEEAVCAETSTILDEFPRIATLLAEDVRAAYEGDPSAVSEAEIVACYPGVRALFVHRVANVLAGRGIPVLPRMMAEHAHRDTGIDIHPRASIGHGVFIDHGTGVVIGETAEVGDRCRIYQGVTLGARSFEREPDGSMRRGYKRHPTLEQDVVVYAGATILGGDTVIGRGSIVSGGVFLTQSVPPGHVVAGPRLELRVRSLGGML